MTADEIKKLKALIVATSLYYGHRIPDEVLVLYVEDLADLDYPAVARAIGELRRDPRTTRFPLPALIRDRIQPADTSENEARDSAARIVAAVARYGWSNPMRAKEYVGELGWHVVERQGGWLNVCQMLTHDNVGFLQAQWREAAISAQRLARMGRLDQAPKLPSSRGGLQAIGQASGPVSGLARIEDQIRDLRDRAWSESGGVLKLPEDTSA